MYKIASWIVFLIFLACFMIVPYMVGLVCRVYIPGWTTPDWEKTCADRRKRRSAMVHDPIDKRMFE